MLYAIGNPLPSQTNTKATRPLYYTGRRVKPGGTKSPKLWFGGTSGRYRATTPGNFTNRYHIGGGSTRDNGRLFSENTGHFQRGHNGQKINNNKV